MGQILAYFICVNHVYEHIPITIAYSISGFIGILATALAVFYNPSDKIVYYYKSTKILKNIQFKGNHK